MQRLETERLILREWRETDVDDLYAYAQNPNVGNAAGWKPHESREESLERIRIFRRGAEVWAVELKEEGRVIGSIGLHADDKRANPGARMLGYVLSEDYWGRGLTPEACRALIRYGFEEMSLDLISVIHYPQNARSRRVIEKLGFRYEGTIRRATPVYSGEIYDDVCYSITREEFRKA